MFWCGKSTYLSGRVKDTAISYYPTQNKTRKEKMIHLNKELSW